MAPQRAGDDREHDIVELGVVRRRDALDRVERQRQRGEAARAVDRDVQRRVRAERESAAQRGQAASALARLRQLRKHAQRVGDVPHQPGGLCGARAQRGPDQRDWPRMLAAPHARRDRARRGARIEQHLRERHAGGAVDGGVVHLRVDGALAGLESLDHVQQPQRARAIESLAVQSRDRRFELRVRAWRR